MPTINLVQERTGLQSAIRRRAIPGLDALRVTAIALVFGYHAGFPLSGSLGVTIFFVLSGFLITTLLLREFRATQDISFSNFYKRRALRIFPAFYVCWALTMVTLHFDRLPLNWTQAFESFFYLADYGRAILPVTRQAAFPMAISWSLAIEEQFYLLWPLVLLCLLKKTRRPELWIAGLIALVWVWRCLLVCRGVSWDYVYNAFDTRLDSLMVGGLLAVIAHANRLPAPAFSFLRSQGTLAAPLFYLVAANCLDVMHLSTLSPAEGNALGLVLYMLTPLSIAAVILHLAYWGSKTWGFLENRWIKLVARLSYSLYLYHLISGNWLGHVIRQWPKALWLPFALLVAAASYYCIERPFLKLRDRGREGDVLLDDGLKHSSAR